MFNDGMFAKYFSFVHFDHALKSTKMNTPVTFYQEAAPVILWSTGDD